jgi:uncharacterized glyoxalase superfamily protein PhnB
MTVRVNAIGLVATDFGATLSFYERLGCEFAAPVEPPHAEADLGGVKLMVDSAESVAQFGDEVGPRHGIALAAQLGTPAEVDALYDELSSGGRGVLKPFDAPWGMRYATVSDPDGTHVDLYALQRG